MPNLLDSHLSFDLIRPSFDLILQELCEMQNRSTVSRLFLVCLFIFHCQPVEAATTLTKVVMTTGSLSEREGVVYVA